MDDSNPRTPAIVFTIKASGDVGPMPLFGLKKGGKTMRKYLLYSENGFVEKPNGAKLTAG